MMADLADITDVLETWKEGKGVILHGAGDAFCSGGNLSFTGNNTDADSGRRMCTLMQDTLWRFFHLPLISVAFLNGLSIGGGAELAVACDFRLVTSKSTLGFVQGRMGLSPGWGGGTRLVQLIGRTDALEILTKGNILSYEEILSLGLANGIVPEETGLKEAEIWLSKRIKGSKEVVAAAKGIVVNAMNQCTEEAIKRERTLFTSLWEGPAHKEALNKQIKHKK